MTVIYSNQHVQANAGEIVSPLYAGPCCASHSIPFGEPQVTPRYEWIFLQCSVCLFTRKLVTRIFADLPESELHRLRERFGTLFARDDKRKGAKS